MKLVIIGGGEHTRVVIEAARSRPDLWDVLGFVDAASATETQERLGVSRLGDDADGLKLASDDMVRFIVGVAAIGSHDVRTKLVKAYGAAGARWATIVHAQAWVSPTAQLADGGFVSAGAVINTGVRAGAHAIVNTGAVIEHDVSIGAFAHVGPAAAIGGGTRIGNNVYVGLGARVRDHIEVGDGATVGMGAIVVKTVLRDVTVLGNPARPRDH